MFNFIKNKFNKMKVRRQAISDLNELPDYLLEDIGITRYDIRNVVDKR